MYVCMYANSNEAETIQSIRVCICIDILGCRNLHSVFYFYYLVNVVIQKMLHAFKETYREFGYMTFWHWLRLGHLALA